MLEYSKGGAQRVKAFERRPIFTDTKMPVHPTNLTCQVLMFLADISKNQWATWGVSFYMPSVQQVFPVGTKERVQQRFMRRLQHKGLVGGCECGCRGDYVITPEGLEMLKADSSSGRQRVAKLLREGWTYHGY